MKLTVHWYGKYADVVLEDGNTTIGTFWGLNQAQRSDLAKHLREIADELSPTTKQENNQ